MPIVTPTSWAGSFISTRGQLVEKVCALKGFSDQDPELSERVLGFLDDTIRDLCTYPWESAKAVESSVALVLNQQYVALTSQALKESQAFLVHTTDGNQAPMRSLPWIQFKRGYPNNVATGIPSVYSIFNFESNGRVYFDRLPDAAVVAGYTLTVEYYRRLPLISSVSTGQNPNIPQEFENTILYGAYKRLCAHVGDENGIRIYSQLEREALERLQRIDIMHPDADRRFRLIDETFVSVPSGYFNPYR